MDVVIERGGSAFGSRLAPDHAIWPRDRTRRRGPRLPARFAARSR